MRNLARLMVMAAAILVPGSATAQSALGVRAGASLAELSGAAGSDGRAGVMAGIYFGFGISDQLAIQLEANYVTRGADNVSIGENDLTGTTGSTVEIESIDLPLLLRAGFPGERFLPSAFVGPYASVLLSCDLTLSTGEAGECDTPTRAAWFSPRSTDYGLVFGVGLDYLLGSTSVFIDVRYALGLLSIQSGDDPMDVRNNTLAVTGGFAFPTSR